MAYFEVKNLTFAYAAAKNHNVLDGVSLSISQGEFLVLCGASGSGKSTFLRHLKSVLTPNGKRTGEILFQGKSLSQVTEREQAEKIGFVLQNPEEQIVTDKVWHELAFGLENLGYDQQTMRSRVAEMACYFGIQDWFHREVEMLSGGQKQLLNLASIMAMQPEILILDEPTSQLDPIAASDFLNTIRKINTELGTTVLMTEHRLEDIFPYADRAIVMEQGRILADDTPAQVCRILQEQKNAMFAAMPTASRVYYGTGGMEIGPLTVRQGRNWLSSEFQTPPKFRSISIPKSPEAAASPALVLKELWFRYEKNGPDILRGVSMTVPAQSIYAVLGGNGAGKSTMMRAICGICKPYRGKIALFQKPISKYSPKELFSGGLAMLPQDPKNLFVKKTVREELEEMTKDAALLEQVAELCKITDLMEHHPYDLSGGEQQRTGLAKVLLTRPRLLLLDEPTKGMDGFFKQSFAQILRDLKKQGITVLMVSHDVEFCAQNTDVVSMFFDGQILSTDTPKRFFGNNSFYTTAAHRMSRHVFKQAVTVEDVIELYQKNKERNG